MLAVIGVLCAIALVSALFLSGRGPLRTHPLAVGLTLIAVTRVWFVLTIPTPLLSDFLGYQTLATTFVQQGPQWGIVPMGWPLALASVYAATGPDPRFGELLNVGIALATGYLIFDIGRRVFGRPAGAYALWLFAAAPAQALWVVVLGTEAPYGLLLAAAVWVFTRLGFDRVLGAVVMGALLGVAQYVRATTPVLLAAFAVVVILFAGTRAHAARALVALTIGFVVVLSPVIAHNIEQTGVPSVSTSLYGGWSLFVGTSAANTGQYDPSLISVPGGQIATPEFDRRALELGLERIRQDPTGVARLALEKLPIMWGSEAYATIWTFNASVTGVAAAVREVLKVSGQVVYALTLVLAAIGVWRWRRRRSAAVVLILLIMLSVAAMHSVLEVQPRYHVYLEPLLCVLAGSALATTRFARPLEMGLTTSDPVADADAAPVSTAVPSYR